MKPRITLVLLMLLGILLSACAQDGRGPGSSPELTGTDGLVISFLGPSSEPERVLDNREQEVTLTVEIANRGAYPEDGSAEGIIWLSGYDRTFMEFEEKGERRFPDGTNQQLFGRTELNNEGGEAVFDFRGSIEGSRLSQGSYQPTILANICYTYRTSANPRICIDPDPYDTTGQEKACEAADLTLGSQGGPVAVTKVEQTPLSDEHQFRMTVKNLGSGQTIKREAVNNQCSEEGKDGLQRDDIGYVRVDSVTVGDQQLECRPLDNGYLRLIEGTGYLICAIQKNQLYTRDSAYATPLEIELSYGYKDSDRRPMNFRKLP